MGERPASGPRALPAARIRQISESGELDAALAECLRGLRARPDDLPLLVLAADIQRRRMRPLAAVEIMRRANRLAPLNDDLSWRYACDLATAGRSEDAEVVLARLPAVEQARPRWRLQRALLAYQRRAFDEAQLQLESLLADYPSFAAAELELAHVLLMQGQWRRGWQAYEARFRLVHTRTLIPRLPSPLWDGQVSADAIVLIADQGYGDCLQFSRYIPLVAERAARVVLMRSPALAGLLETVPGVTQCHERWEDMPPHAAHVPLSGLPRLFDTQAHSIPSGTGLLGRDITLVRHWQEQLKRAAGDAKLRVGIAWSGRADFRDNFLRAVPVAALAPLLEINDCCFVSLQFGPLMDQGDELGLLKLSAPDASFATSAALVEALDLVITSDTALAHLAASLGRPTWILLQHAPDWRWGASSARSAWYPSARLFRQDARRDWAPVVAAVAAALKSIIAAPAMAPALAAWIPPDLA